jgi:hypothetical protein
MTLVLGHERHGAGERQRDRREREQTEPDTGTSGVPSHEVSFKRSRDSKRPSPAPTAPDGARVVEPLLEMHGELVAISPARSP